MKVVVVGGGTAGCISALLFKKKFPSIDLTMVRSQEKGILGPGEGLTPSINSFLKDIDISIYDFIYSTGGTIKNGVMFNNWDTNGSSWFHGFYDFYNDSKNIIDDKDIVINNFKTAVNTDNNLNSLNYLYYLSKDGKINLENDTEYGFHIDARKLVIFLEDIAEKMGIKIIDSIVSTVEVDQHNDIDAVILSNGKKLKTDFVVDCSGFEKLIIGKHYNSEWVSMDKYLPATHAVACFLPIDNNIKPYTDATAMKYGWSWKIPLQHRYGCGYVYDSKYITKEEAEAELFELYGDKLEVVNHFKYTPGFFKQTWIRNCFANGLSSSFFEPIEATTISGVITTMYKFLIDYFPKYIKQKISENNDDIQNQFNNEFVISQMALMSMLHLHYRTNRNDTDFWINFNSSYPFPKWDNFDIEKFIENMNSGFINNNLDIPMWQEYSWLSIYAGNMLHSNKVELDISSIEMYNKSVRKVKDVADLYKTDHLEFLQTIKEMKENI